MTLKMEEQQLNHMLFWIVEMLFGLFVWNSNGELRRTAVIPSPSRNSRTTTILTVPKQGIYVWLYLYYFYSENNNYSAVLVPSKHTHTKNIYIYIYIHNRYVTLLKDHHVFVYQTCINLCTFMSFYP
jgi:hypothetical protein